MADKAVVVMVPRKVTVIPEKETLRANERLVFQVLVSDNPQGEVIWAALSPTHGELSPKGEYQVPKKIPEDQTVLITAIAKVSGDQGHARITLLADEWQGWKPHALGGWLVVLALILAAKVYFLWPPPLDRSKLNAAVAAQAAAQRMLDQPQSALREAEEAAARLANQLGEAEKKTPDPQAPALQVLREEQHQAYETVRTRAAAVNLTDQDLADRRTAVTIEEETIKRVQTPVRSGISCT